VSKQVQFTEHRIVLSEEHDLGNSSKSIAQIDVWHKGKVCRAFIDAYSVKGGVEFKLVVKKPGDREHCEVKRTAQARYIDARQPLPSEGLRKFFGVEIRNEEQGGVRPATLYSALSSFIQAPVDVMQNWSGVEPIDQKELQVELIGLCAAYGGDTELATLLK
jgi:hypothetical protein